MKAGFEKAKSTRTEEEVPEEGVFSEFCDYTSTHGPNHIKRVKVIWGKLTWSAITLAFTGVVLWQISLLFMRYRRFDYNVLIDVKFDRNLEFPAVTLCNLNPYRRRQVEKLSVTDPQLGALFDAARNGRTGAHAQTRRRKRRMAEELSGSTPSEGSATEYEEEDPYDFYDYEFWEDVDYEYEEYDMEFSLDDQISNSINMLPQSTRTTLGHALSTMLLGCNFAGKPCSPRNFTRIWNHQYGNCYTLNGINSTAQLTATRPGPQYGLVLELYIELGEYEEGFVHEAGVRVTIHDRSQVPFPELNGINVPVRFRTDIGLRKLQVERLGSPYYTCEPRNTSDWRNIYAARYPNSYNSHVCELSCYQRAVMDHCGCLDSEFPVAGPMIPEGIPICNAIKLTKVNQTHLLDDIADCAGDWWNEYVAGSIQCECPQVCSEVQFLTTTSSAGWPMPTYAYMEGYEMFLHDLRKPSITQWLQAKEDLTAPERHENIRNNVLQVGIYYEDLNYEKIYQKPSYTLNQLLSDLGGQLGLWVGMSVMSIIEWFELLGRLISSCRQRSRSRPRSARVMALGKDIKLY